MQSRSSGQDWIVSWHPPRTPLEGTPHGAAGVCLTSDHQLVLISHDGKHWGFPAGRPEGHESPEETLHREMLEEACATVTGAQLLGFARSECVNGWQYGLVLVRSYWRADVEVAPWKPMYEIRHRRLVAAAEATDHVRDPDPVATRISHRALAEAGLS
ncbi:NUDIX hydrolase [Kibdelosporangium persicum]|uniref:NUDIX hydrolase n=1 Tax=Kibdelosporangium persicum TaxID=2698649 RepID=UPI0024839077|nr:NUDIX hydrolase [Kibdelosporangium persicum]